MCGRAEGRVLQVPFLLTNVGLCTWGALWLAAETERVGHVQPLGNGDLTW